MLQGAANQNSCAEATFHFIISPIELSPSLVKVVEGLVEVGLHAGGRLVGDLDGGLEDALRNDVVLGAGRRLGAQEDPVPGSCSGCRQKLSSSQTEASQAINISCCSVSLQFLWDILITIPVLGVRPLAVLLYLLLQSG